MNKTLGNIVSGSISEGFTCQLSSQVKLGQYVCINTGESKIFCIINDFFVEVKNLENFYSHQKLSPLFCEIFKKHYSLSFAKLSPLLNLCESKIEMISNTPQALDFVEPASKEDFEKIFGQENLQDSSKPFKASFGTTNIGGFEVCVELKKLVERSNGIFGKTGSGKTFLTRLILASLIKTEVASCLIFDMHGEYGLSARSEDGKFVLGLKSLFPNKVLIFSLDPEATRQRGCSPDFEVSFDLSEITGEDIISLQSELNLHPTAIEAANLLNLNFGKNWIKKLFSYEKNIKELAQEIGAHTESLSALLRKLKRFESFPFIRNDEQKTSSLADIVLEFLDKKMNVVFEFGRQNSKLAYLLVSGILTRKIHSFYVKKTENFLATQQQSAIPHPLMIVIEEAHNFLSPSLAKQTIFGTIAREMRKYFVTLLVIDQRPSGICDEILSQIGTKILTKLDDEKDILAVTTGANPNWKIKNLLNSLALKNQSIILGHATPIPAIINNRFYGENFYKLLGSESEKDLKSRINEIF